MSVAKVVEITATSPEGFEQAIQNGITRAGETIKGIRGAWVNELNVRVEDDKVTEYRVNLKVTFVLEK